MDFKPFLERIDEAGATNACIRVLVDCTAELMDELHNSLNPMPKVFLPSVVAALDRLKSIYLVDEDDEGKKKIQRMANSLNSAFQVVAQVEHVDRRDME